MRLAILASLSLCAAVPVFAQTGANLPVRVRVVDSAGMPMEDIPVSAIEGVRNVRASGVTDRNGYRTLVVSGGRSLESIQLVARRVGYLPAMRLVPVDQRDTLRVDLMLRRAVAQLDAVNVTAEQDVKRNRTYVDAEAIAAFDRPLYDVGDIIEKMRPNMLLEPKSFGEGCKKLQNVWVNGKRVAWFIPSIHDARQRPIVRTSQAINVSSKARIGPALSGITEYALEIIAEIQPEHISSIEYRDCMSNDQSTNGGNSALFITLKDGVAFDYKSGSYVLGPEAQDSITRRVFRKDANATPRTPETP